MKDDQLKTLDELLKESLQEKKKIEKELSKNLNRIKEIDTFLDSMTEASDFKVFSPRTAESLHREEIKEEREEKDKLEISNDSYYKKIGKLEGDIERISFLIDEHKKTTNNLHLIILDMQEKERGRIARELHDSSIQNLTHLIHSLELSSLYIDKDPIQAKLELESCSQTLKKAIDEIRDTVFDLRPMSFDDLGFNQCIENLVDTLKTQNPEFTFVTDVDLFDPKTEKDQINYGLFLVSIYRIVHEALLNAVKHSCGSKIELSVKKSDDRLVIKVIDNGKGFVREEGCCSADKHFGISVMQERVFLLSGIFEINSKIGEGTRIFISLPYNFSS